MADIKSYTNKGLYSLDPISKKFEYPRKLESNSLMYVPNSENPNRVFDENYLRYVGWDQTSSMCNNVGTIEERENSPCPVGSSSYDTIFSMNNLEKMSAKITQL